MKKYSGGLVHICFDHSRPNSDIQTPAEYDTAVLPSYSYWWDCCVENTQIWYIVTVYEFAYQKTAKDFSKEHLLCKLNNL